MDHDAKDATPGPLLFLGAPGAGKGTQATEVSKKLGIPHISTGDIFRENVRKQTPLGQQAKIVMDAGGLVGDDIVNAMVRERLSSDDCRRGFLLDGYPRTLPQAESLRSYLEERGLPQPIVVSLRVSYNTVVQRLSGRRVCPVCSRTYNLSSQPPARDGICDSDGAPLQQRSDDREEAIRKRLAAYEAETAPLVDFYKKNGRFFDVNADQSPEEISLALTRLLQVP